jgi:hypothetical protein
MGILRDRLKDVLDRLCGNAAEGTLEYRNPPKGLNATRDNLKKNYRGIWLGVNIRYNGPTYGAAADHGTNEIIFGEFFLKTEITKPGQKDKILDKVFLHEFLHLVVDLPRPLHHGQLNKIIKKHLGYHGDPNPLGTD